MYSLFFFFQAEDGIRDLVRFRGLGDVYKRQVSGFLIAVGAGFLATSAFFVTSFPGFLTSTLANSCLLYTSDAADERSSVDLGGRRIIKKKKKLKILMMKSVLLTKHYTRIDYY